MKTKSKLIFNFESKFAIKPELKRKFNIILYAAVCEQKRWKKSWCQRMVLPPPPKNGSLDLLGPVLEQLVWGWIVPPEYLFLWLFACTIDRSTVIENRQCSCMRQTVKNLAMHGLVWDQPYELCKVQTNRKSIFMHMHDYLKYPIICTPTMFLGSPLYYSR